MDKAKERMVLDFSLLEVGQNEDPGTVLSREVGDALSKEPHALQLNNLQSLRYHEPVATEQGDTHTTVDLNFGGYYGGPDCAERIIALVKELAFARKFSHVLLEALPRPSEERQDIAQLLSDIQKA